MTSHVFGLLITCSRKSTNDFHIVRQRIMRLYSTDNRNVRPIGPTRTTTDLILERNFRMRKKRLQRKIPHTSLSRTLALRVVCNGAWGLSNSVVLASDTEMYLFNCGELTHRMLVDNELEGSVKNIFFTHNSWRNTGGLMGLLMSKIRKVDMGGITRLYGPDHVGSTLKLVRFFESDSSALAQTESVGLEAGRFEDSQVTIEYVQLLPDVPEAVVETDTIGDDTESEDTTSVKKAVVYIITPKSRPHRKLDIDKLMALGVESGPWVGELARGNSVTLENGLVVTPEDILEETFSPRPIIIVECPSLDYISSLLSSERLRELIGQTDAGPELLVHMSPVAVVSDTRYTSFMNSFSSNTHHLMLNETCPGPYLKEASQFVGILNQLHPDLFPLLQAHTQVLEPSSPGVQPITQDVSGLCYGVKPARGFTKPRRTTLYSTSALQMDDRLQRHLTSLQNNVDTVASKQGPDSTGREDYPEIVFLGTGSTLPLGTRSSSSILVQMRKDEYLLLDCGEGTLSQLYQLYGPHVSHILENLKAVFISHLHYDHHGGLFSVLEGRHKLYEEKGRAGTPVTVLAPIMLQRWLRKYSHLNQVPLRLIPHHFMYECFSTNNDNVMWNEVNSHLSAKQCIPVPVNHVSNSYGLVFEHQDGWKLVYSGDTRPCPLLIDIGRDCDILIHEATFPDGSEKLAATKKHSTTDWTNSRENQSVVLTKMMRYHRNIYSTTGQAIAVGRQMSAQFTMLTHFSHHVTGNIPVFTEDFTDNVGFAFDFMTVRPSTLPHIPHLKPVLKHLFWDEQQERQLLHRTNFSSFDKGLLDARSDRMNYKSVQSARGKKSNTRTQTLIDNLSSVSQKRKQQ